VRNCLILGSGRSGTSLAAGVLHTSGYFMGQNLNPANETNPKGQFEDREVNAINEKLLAQVLRSRPNNFLGDIFFKGIPVDGQRWLARLPHTRSVPSLPAVEDRMRFLTARQPFCFKDPRFSYTLRVWRPFLPDTVFLCIFRHPAVTVASILNQRRRVPHLKNFSINARQAFRVWTSMYMYILEVHHPEDGGWEFFHYDQFLDGSAYERLEQRLQTKVDRSFADSRLSRSQSRHKVDQRTQSLYLRLCALAGHRRST